MIITNIKDMELVAITFITTIMELLVIITSVKDRELVVIMTNIKVME